MIEVIVVLLSFSQIEQQYPLILISFFLTYIVDLFVSLGIVFAVQVSSWKGEDGDFTEDDMRGSRASEVKAMGSC